MVYDGDGNRVSQTAGGVTTTYLMDTLNPTGYSQLLDELDQWLGDKDIYLRPVLNANC